jgi:hypothetical protein
MEGSVTAMTVCFIMFVSLQLGSSVREGPVLGSNGGRFGSVCSMQTPCQRKSFVCCCVIRDDRDGHAAERLCWLGTEEAPNPSKGQLPLNYPALVPQHILVWSVNLTLGAFGLEPCFTSHEKPVRPVFSFYDINREQLNTPVWSAEFTLWCKPPGLVSTITRSP